MDYRLPRAADIPDIRFETRNVPSTTNILGMKGAGEAGAIGSCPAVMNAVVDALRDYGVRHVDMPATPDRVIAILRESGALARAA
jgi:carbon-monoxide dehydrogenase large subunit